jgi:prepilin-type N-terminal cleavage/methylation domain-containing protein
MRRHFGFTLIEVMIVTAVAVVLLGAVFSVNFRITDMWRSERVRQSLQQNFRFAADMMTTNLRQATAISLPVANTFGDVLQFDYVATPVPHETRHRVTYRRAGSSPYRVERVEEELQYSSGDGKWNPVSGTSTTVPITEDIPTLAAVHFINRGSQVVAILVAQYESGGSVQAVSYTLQTSVRTLFE